VGLWSEALIDGRRDALEPFPADATEQRMSRAEILVDTDVELIGLLGGVDGVAVRCVAIVGRRQEILQQARRHRIDARRRNDVAGKRLTGGWIDEWELEA